MEKIEVLYLFYVVVLFFYITRKCIFRENHGDDWIGFWQKKDEGVRESNMA